MDTKEAEKGKAKLPPMLTQYLEYKRQYPDCHLFFQVGDFYELFFEDAVAVSKVLNLTLTTRDKNDPDPVPMCGVPISVIDNYLERLVTRGHSVAIVSQCEAPAAGKGMVARRLERIITPGIRLFSNNADADASGAVVAALVVHADDEASIAFTDVQSGVVVIREQVSMSALSSELLKTGASELVVPKTLSGRPVDRRLGWVRELDRLFGQQGLKLRPETSLDYGTQGERDITSIPGFAALSPLARKATRLLISYIDETTLSSKVSITSVSARMYEQTMVLDASTRANLELVRNTRDGGEHGTLFKHLDCTRTIGGAKQLRQWILNPLCAVDQILERQNAVKFLIDERDLRDTLVSELSRVADMERIAARLELNVVSPRELGALRDSVQRLPALNAVFARYPNLGASSGLLGQIAGRLTLPSAVIEQLEARLVDAPPLGTNEGGIIREGYDREIDTLRQVKQSGSAWMLELEAGERARTGISSLKIKFNNVLGYFIEVTRANAAKVPAEYIRRQSTVNAERFTTPELREREAQVLGADAKIVQRERELFEALKEELRPHAAAMRALAFELSRLDVLAALAQVAEREGYVAPVIDDSSEIAIVEGRHPVLASRLGSAFVPNSLDMGSERERCLIITGPNMGGKSTYIRQAGLLVILAQMGSFVPARAAKIGVVDRIFARIGASDNIAEGESTFMVEMREASHILAGATSRSLLLIDEIGRGTATSDGLAIAQAILEWIVLKISCRTLFATHFHELTELEQVYPAIRNLSVGSVDRDGDVVFTHVIAPGSASRSYGIEVAKLAGLPAALLARSRELLTALARQKTESGKAAGSQLALFSAPRLEEPAEPEDYAELKGLRAQIERIDVNELSPLEALIKLSKLQSELRGKQ